MVWKSDNFSSSYTAGAFVTWNGVVRPTASGTTFVAALNGIGASPHLAVSAPTDPSRGSRYLIVDLNQDPLHAFQTCLRATVVDRNGAVVAYNATLSDGAHPDYSPAVDTDGGRFAVSFMEYVAPNRSLQVGTYDIVGQQVVQHELLAASPVGMAPGNWGLVSMHGAGGGSSLDREYALVWLDDPSTPYTVYTRRYRGMAGAGIGIRATGCGPLSFAYTGSGAIGTTIGFQQSGGTGIGGFAFGSPASVPLPQCPGCTLGTTLDVLLIGNAISFAIPFDTNLVGVTVSLQGFDYGFGTCLGALWLGDTGDLPIH